MLENRKNNPLYNKYIACLGDSYTGGVNNNWVSFIGSRTGAKMVNYGSFGSSVLPMDCQLLIDTQDYSKASDMVAVGDTYTCTDLYSNAPVNFTIKAASTTDLKITINITSGVMRNMYDNAGQVTATKTGGSLSSVASFVLGTPVQIEDFASRARRINANYADVIAVFGGVNDAMMVHAGRETIGTLDGMEEGSFYKNYRDLLVQIIKQFPAKKVITIAPPHIQSGATDYSGDIADISKAVKDISQLLAVPCADLFNGCCGFSNIA
jgi:lysophospholipase L1-like esterase